MSHGSDDPLIGFTEGLWTPPRWGRRAGLLLPLQRGPGYCRWCGKDCAPPRTHWCADECVQKYLRVGTWKDLCQRVRERDQVCRNCGGGGLTRGLVVPDHTDLQGHHHPEYTKLIARFEVDHIVAIDDGGTDDPKNLRLLCIPCHKLITALWHRRRARRGQCH